MFSISSLRGLAQRKMREIRVLVCIVSSLRGIRIFRYPILGGYTHFI